MTNKEVKENFISNLFSRGVYTRKVSNVEYVTRCPFCGDSNDPSHGHFYIHIDLDKNTNMVFNCFKCSTSGVVTKDVCKRLDIDDLNILSGVSTLNKTAEKIDKLSTTDNILKFDYDIPDKYKMDWKIMYIKNRLQIPLNESDLRKIKVVTSLYDFLNLNKIKKLTCENWQADMIEKYYIGFVSYGNGYILFRDVTGKMNIPWLKYPITEESREGRAFYTVGARIDPYTNDEININLCEGVMDAISVCYNLGYNGDNNLNIAVAGKFYEGILRYVISLGLFGDNVRVNIFADNDEKFNKKNKGKDTTLDFYKKLFKHSKLLFKSVKVFYNIKQKDCGYPKSEIILKEYRI